MAEPVSPPDPPDSEGSSRGSIDSSHSVGSEKDFLASTSLGIWAGRRFIELPPPPPAALPVNCTKGWPSYLTSRWPGDSKVVARVHDDPCTLDGLTYPITLAFLLASLKYVVQGELTVLVLGAMARVEEQLLRETTYWGEIAVCLRCRVHLVLCGPEVSATHMHGEPEAPPAPNSDTRASLFSGSFTAYRDKFGVDVATTVLVAYNAGFANFTETERLQPLFSWFSDLRSIVDSRVPAFFTQANDSTDLAGETAIMAHVLGARFIVLPTQNPFSAATRSVPGDGSQAWSCANHSFYAVQGCDEARVQCRKCDISTQRGMRELQEAATKSTRLGTDLAALEHMTTRIQTDSPRAAEATHNLKELDVSGASERPSKQQRLESPNNCSGLTPAALISAATLLNESEAEVQENGKVKTEHPVPNYRLEVSPEEGLIRATVSLPLLESARAVDVEVYRGELLVAAEGVYSMLKVTLPSPVNEETVTATFDRKRRELELTLQAR